MIPPALQRGHGYAAALILILLPVLLALPQLIGVLKPDPLLVNASIATGVEKGVLIGVPFIDPNAGFQTQALGYRSAADWLEGRVPWWNSYSGIGLPLAAEYQPASFFPLTLLMLLPLGMVFLHIVLQAACGIGAYLVLRRLACARTAALAGALLFELNGTVAWFAHAPASVVPTLPWIVYGIERARHAATHGGHGWRTLAVAMALSLLAGFPETAYIDGLLCLSWAVVRGLSLERRERTAFAIRVVAGGAVALMLAAPQLLPFFQYLPQADVGGHGDMSHFGFPSWFAVGSLVAPYVFGPIFAYQEKFPDLLHFWGTAGGYATILLIAVAVHGFWQRRDALAFALLGWILLCLGKTFLVQPALGLWNLVPGIAVSAFARYAQPSWEFALAILAAFALEPHEASRVRAARRLAALVSIAMFGWSLVILATLAHQLSSSRGLVNSVWGSMAWAAITLAFGLAWLGRAGHAKVRARLATLLVVDAALMAFIPVLSAPKAGAVDATAVRFLQDHLGFQRFFTLGPITPNYGAYFGIASINHNYLPVSARWRDEIRRGLQPHREDAVVFDGRDMEAPSMARDRVAELSRLGVRYVVAPAGLDPYKDRDDIQVAYRDELLTIFELPGPAPYFETIPAGCDLSFADRESAVADCAAPALLVRRELYFPGWRATRAGTHLAILPFEDLFQSVQLPPGRSEVRFHYSPPHIEWAWAAMLLAALCLAASASGPILRRRTG